MEQLAFAGCSYSSSYPIILPINLAISTVNPLPACAYNWFDDVTSFARSKYLSVIPCNLHDSLSVSHRNFQFCKVTCSLDRKSVWATLRPTRPLLVFDFGFDILIESPTWPMSYPFIIACLTFTNSSVTSKIQSWYFSISTKYSLSTSTSKMPNKEDSFSSLRDSNLGWCDNIPFCIIPVFIQHREYTGEVPSFIDW